MAAGGWDLLVSSLFICLSCWLAFWVRRLVPRAFPEKPTLQALFLEAVATWDLCAACFELVIIADNFGVGTYAIYLFLLTIWWSRAWGDATACPYTHLEDVVTGHSGFGWALALIWAQLTGGILVYRYTRFMWSLEVSNAHQGRAYEECVADLQVSMLLGAIIEAAATCLCRLCSRGIATVEPVFASALDSFVGTSLVVLAFNYSGGYFNPALATSLKFGCKGNTTFEHLFVYWLGSCSGAIASVFLYEHPLVQQVVHQVASKLKKA